MKKDASKVQVEFLVFAEDLTELLVKIELEVKCSKYVKITRPKYLQSTATAWDYGIGIQNYTFNLVQADVKGCEYEYKATFSNPKL